MITLSINLSKLDKSRIIEGKNGKYVNIVIWPKDTDQYGNNLSVQQSLTKEERAAGVKAIYIGDGKDWDSVPTTKPDIMPNGTSVDSIVDLPNGIDQPVNNGPDDDLTF